MPINPQHTKANRIEIKKGVPSPNEGNNGELRLGITSKGIFLYAKYGNRWYQLGDSAVSSGSTFAAQSISPQGAGKLATSINRSDESLNMGGKIILGDNVITQQGSSTGVQFNSSNQAVINNASTKIGTNGRMALSDNEIDISSGDLTLDVAGNVITDVAGGDFTIQDDTASKPVLELKNLTNDATSAILKFTNERTGGVGANNDRAGIIQFWTEDDAGNSTNVGTISSSISDVTDGSEDGYVSIEALGGTTSEIRLDSGGVVNLDAANTNDTFGVQFSLNGTMVGNITGHHAKTYFTLYENIGASTNDKFYIGCGANGATDIGTQDGAGTAADLTIVPDGSLSLEPSASLTLKSSVHQLEQASADADQAGYGQLWTKNATPNELYFTNDAGNDIQITSGSSMAGGGGGTSYWIQQWSGRAYTKNLNWFRPNSIYGIAYYNWNTNTNSTSLPSTWPDSNNPMIVVPKDCTLTEYNFTGNFNSAQTYEVALMKGTGVTYGSAGDYTLSNVGSTQSQAATAMILYSIGETGLSVSLSKGDMLVPFVRRTTLDSVSQFFFELSMSIVCEVS